MQTRELFQRIEREFKSGVADTVAEGVFPSITVAADSLKNVLSYCAHDAALAFDFLENLTAVDTGQDFVVLYQLYSTTLFHRLNIKVIVSRHIARLASATGFWRSAHCYELEAAEMFGLTFEGHPAPRRLLLPADWQGFPLRKDYVFPEEYHGIEHRREPLRKDHVRP